MNKYIELAMDRVGQCGEMVDDLAKASPGNMISEALLRQLADSDLALQKLCLEEREKKAKKANLKEGRRVTAGFINRKLLTVQGSLEAAMDRMEGQPGDGSIKALLIVALDDLQKVRDGGQAESYSGTAKVLCRDVKREVSAQFISASPARETDEEHTVLDFSGATISGRVIINVGCDVYEGEDDDGEDESPEETPDPPTHSFRIPVPLDDMNLAEEKISDIIEKMMEVQNRCRIS